jgi:hypothetical protein
MLYFLPLWVKQFLAGVFPERRSEYTTIDKPL